MGGLLADFSLKIIEEIIVLNTFLSLKKFFSFSKTTFLNLTLTQVETVISIGLYQGWEGWFNNVQVTITKNKVTFIFDTQILICHGEATHF